ncbi:MAG: ATP-binding protein [Alphaproteobacteria bacterium]|nr:ATP-binding protein [Alphaproteobacteria bacterium]
MRLWGLQRDYIFSFLAEPGRVLTPACVNEIWNEKIGPNVRPASEAVVRSFVSNKLNATGFVDEQNFDQPISLWRIQQTLIWNSPDQSSFPFEEGYETEFKIVFQPDKSAKYMKTMCAFANASGGYMFFGVSDGGMPITFEPSAFRDHDWDAFDKLLHGRFSPYVRWSQTIVDLPGMPDHQLDTHLIKRLATAKNVPPERYEWLTQPGEKPPRPVGVIYTYPCRERVRCVKTISPDLKNGLSYVRLKGRNASYENEQDIPTSVNRAGLWRDGNNTRISRLADFDTRRRRRIKNSSKGRGHVQGSLF